MPDVLAPPADAPTEELSLPRGAGPVIQGGLVTTGLTLCGLLLLNHYDVDFNPMGLYGYYVIPVGAVLVGVAAGSGYGLMSWLRGVRVRRGLLASVVLLQLLAYGACEYLAYRDDFQRASAAAGREGETIDDPGFVRWYHYKTINFAFKPKHGSGPGQPLGTAGYLFAALAAAGFVGGGLVVPLATMAKPYCAGCQRYMRTKHLGLIPASVMNRKFKKADAAEGRMEWAADNDAAAAAAETRANELGRLAAAGEVGGFQAEAAKAFGEKKATGKLPARLSTDLVHCPACRRGWLRQTAVRGQGKEVSSTRLSQIEVAGAFTEGVLAGPSA